MKRNAPSSVRGAAGAPQTSKPDMNPDPQSQQQQGADIQDFRQAEPEEIAVAAYHLYLSRGAEDGNDVDHWLEAERNLNSSASGVS